MRRVATLGWRSSSRQRWSRPSRERAAEIVAEQNAGYLDVKGAAHFLGGCSPKRIYNLVERGAIPHYKPHGRLLFDPRELREWVEGRGERSRRTCARAASVLRSD